MQIFNSRRKIFLFYKQAWIFMLPICIQALVETVINLTNNFVVGQFGDTNTITGVSSSTNVYDIVWYIFLAIVSTGNIFTAQYLGDNNHQKIKETTNVKLVYTLFSSIIFLIVLELFSNQIISAILGNKGADRQKAINAGAEYTKLISWNYPLLGFAYIMSLTMNAVGKIKVPFYISLVSIIVNTILVCTLSLPSQGLPNLGITGLAISLITTRAIECLIYIVYFSYKKPDYAPNINIFKVSKHLHWIYFKAFIPMFIGQTLWGVYFILQTSLYSYFGHTNNNDVIVSAQITNTVTAVFYSTFRGYTALVSFYVGTKLGAGKLQLARENATKIIQLSLINSFVISIIIAVCALWIPPVLYPNLDSYAKYLTTWFLGFSAFSYFFINMLQPLYNFLYAGGYVLVVTVFDLFLVYIVDIFVTFALLKWSSLSVDIVIMISCLTKAVDFITSYIFYRVIPWNRKIIPKDYHLD